MPVHHPTPRATPPGSATAGLARTTTTLPASSTSATSSAASTTSTTRDETAGHAPVAPRPHRGASERGDVPGWVLVTLMSALLVVALLGVAKGELTSVFRNAINSVSSP